MPVSISCARASAVSSGKAFTRGHLYKLLANPIYIGRVPHKAASNRGQHAAIIDKPTWDAVQAQLAQNTQGPRRRRRRAKAREHLLEGLLHAEAGMALLCHDMRRISSVVVRWGRHLRQWKATTLADFARVSLSTVERVERGDKVSDEALDRIAQALGYETGAFTTPRLPIGPEKAAEQMVDTYGHLEPVAVAPMKTHKAIRDAARCHAYLIHRPEVPDTYDADIANLGEWLDLASFILSDILEDSPSERGRRDLYNDILACVTELERRGLTVLSGVMAAPQPGLPDWKVAIVSVTPRLTDPGAPKRRHVMVDRRCVALPPNALADA